MFQAPPVRVTATPGTADATSRADGSTAPVELSVVIVNYNAGPILLACLAALHTALRSLRAEVIVVDNASRDGMVAAIRKRYPDIAVIVNQRNVGFAAACNQGLRRSRGQYVLLLNPDAVVAPDAVTAALDWLQTHPDVGICGAKVLRADGRLDGPCRRSFKTPAMYFYRFLGLTRLFPQSRRFGRYYLSYLDPDQTTDVDAVVGAFLLIRRTTVAQIGLLDERFFMYCEDEDWCFRAKQAGWRVVYYPTAVVTHYKGTSSQQRRVRAAWYWHRSVLQHHRKNIAAHYHPLINGVVYGGIAVSLAYRLLLPALTGMKPAARSSVTAIEPDTRVS